MSILDRPTVEARLATLRDQPVDTSDNGQNVLAPIYTYLMSIPPDRSDGRTHWFCPKADPVTQEAAAFLIRLFAYDSQNVTAWKKRFKACISECCQCIQGLEAAKVTSRHTYFGVFPDETIRLFYANFDSWEVEMVMESLSAAGCNLESLENRTLVLVPQPIVYHILCNPSILQDPRILSYIRTAILPENVSDWPTDPPPPGLLLLMMDENSDVRRWAQSIALKSKIVPIPVDSFTSSFKRVLDLVSDAFSAKRSQSLLNTTASPPYPFAQDSVSLWAGFLAVLRLVPVELLTSNVSGKVDLRRIVIGHLHNIGPELSSILKAFILLLKRLGNRLWEGEQTNYPEIVFDSIKDNSSYLDLLLRNDTATERPWYFAWYSEFLHTVSGLVAYDAVLAKTVGFMCEELQHERFGQARSDAMCAAVRLLANAINKSRTELSEHREATSRILTIHTDVFIAVAFGKLHGDSDWHTARSKVREMISTVLLQDVHSIMDVIKRVCQTLAGDPKAVIPAISTHRHLWTKAYETVQPSDIDGFKTLLAVVAQVAHLTTLRVDSFDPMRHKLQSSASSAISNAVQEINRSLSLIHEGLQRVMSRFANDNDTSTVLDLLRSPGVVRCTMMLMLSPVEDSQDAARTLVGQAFDVDVRMDCFRALLENIPEASLDGIFAFLDLFIKYAPAVPEACSLSKSLVRCLTDVIEVLCASHNGLLRSPHYSNPAQGFAPATNLLKFWGLMSKSISVIFKRTPSWSIYFSENQVEMTVWMRDALIFGRDMLAQRRVLEAAIVRSEDLVVGSQVSKSSPTAKKMVDQLQEVLPELARWLRLTDEELLHQSFSLLQTLLDCFRETAVQPSPEGVNKLTKHIDGARKGRSQSRLDTNRLSQLEDSLASFIDDEIEILSHTTAPSQRQRPEERRVASDTRKPADAATTSQHKSRVPESNLPSSSRAPQTGFGRDWERHKGLPSLRKADKGFSFTSGAARRRDATAKNEGDSRFARLPDSSSGSESDDEAPGSLKALGGYQKPVAVKQPTERRQVKILDLPRNRDVSVQDRREEARRTALRLRPNVSGLHKVVLAWDYDHAGQEPPVTGNNPQRLHVPDQFRDHAHYLQVFEPLLILECWSQIAQSKTQVNDSYRVKITSKQFVDDWLDVDIDITDSVKKDWYLSEPDVVLLRHTERQSCSLAKVRNYSARPWGIQAGIRCYAGANGGDPNLQINSTWRISKVFSLSTIHREYSALMALPYYQFFDTVLRPRLNKVSVSEVAELRKIMTEYQVNEPQAIAIFTALRTEGFTLIQGPPGTGKTSTICGLVDVFLSSRPRPATAVHAGRNSTASDKQPPRKVLLCAPSNAAIDELASRISQFSRTTGNRKGTWKVVRIGADKSINLGSKEIALEFLIEQRLQSEQGSSNNISNEITAAQAELESVRRRVQEKKAEEMAVRDNAARLLTLQNELKDLNLRRKMLSQNYDALKDKQKSHSRSLDATRRKIRSEILMDADVICSTLSGAGQDILEPLEFEMIVIDEAAQSIELSSLIPLRHNCKRCIMVGDPQQLPPTVLSQEASRFNYNQSLFVRLQRQHPDVVQFLRVQYRMHPHISQLPSRLFYGGQLVDGPNMATKTQQPWHSHEKFGTYRFYNVNKGREETTPSQSLRNVAEAHTAVALFQALSREFSTIDLDRRVGVVSMYSAQVAELRRAFMSRFGENIVDRVTFHTVDGFQGQEKDIIILSCVRAGPGLQNVGFLADTRRMNVSLTRAKSSLFILGNAATLERSNQTWGDIVRDSRTRNLLTDADPDYFTTQSHLPRVAISAKVPKAAPIPLPAVPDNLLTPRQLTKADQRLPPSQTANTLLPRRPDAPQGVPIVKNGNWNVTEDTGQKRPFRDEPIETSSPSDTIPAKPPEPIRRPLVKRPKQPANIFIPKAPKLNKPPG